MEPNCGKSGVKLRQKWSQISIETAAKIQSVIGAKDSRKVRGRHFGSNLASRLNGAEEKAQEGEYFDWLCGWQVWAKNAQLLPIVATNWQQLTHLRCSLNLACP